MTEPLRFRPHRPVRLETTIREALDHAVRGGHEVLLALTVNHTTGDLNIFPSQALDRQPADMLDALFTVVRNEMLRARAIPLDDHEPL